MAGDCSAEFGARSRALQHDFLKLLNNARLSNVSFVCRDNSVIYADKALLAARCDYFDKLLFGGLKETAQEQIYLPTAVSSHLLVVFEFLHAGRLSLPLDAEPELVMGVYELARQYNILDLQEDVLAVLPDLIDTVNVGEYLTTAAQVYFMKEMQYFTHLVQSQPPFRLVKKYAFDSFLTCMVLTQLSFSEVENLALAFCSSMEPLVDMFEHFTMDALLRYVLCTVSLLSRSAQQPRLDVFEKQNWCGPP